MGGVKRSWKVIPALVAIFLAGGISGFLLAAVVVKQSAQRMARPEFWQARTMERMERRLDLTDEQKEQVRPILESTSVRIFEHYRDASMQSWQEVRVLFEELDTILDAEQQAKVEETRERIRKRVEARGLLPREDRADAVGGKAAGEVDGTDD